MKTFRRQILVRYLFFWARLVLRRHRPSIVGITGSVGKTTTKEAVAAVLMHRDALPVLGPVWKSAGNMNDKLGVPLAVLGYHGRPRLRHKWAKMIIALPLRALSLATARTYPRILVLEYGVGWGSDIGQLAQLAPPSVAVVTAVGPAHLDQFETVERVAEEKSALVRAVSPSGLVVLGQDNNYASMMDRVTQARVMKLPGRGIVLAESIARAVGAYFGLPEEVIERGLGERRDVDGRLEIIESEGLIIINDAFNANPLSMRLGIDALVEYGKAGRRKVAILGEMALLGRESPHYHQEIAAYAHERADFLIGVGEMAKHYQPDCWYATSEECAAHLKSFIRRGDCVLVKGSGSVRLREVVQELRQVSR